MKVLMGKSLINGPFSIAMFDYQRAVGSDLWNCCLAVQFQLLQYVATTAMVLGMLSQLLAIVRYLHGLTIYTQPRCQVCMFSHGRLKVVQVWVLDLKNLKLHKLNLIAFLKGDV